MMEIKEIMNILPHAYPFLLVDRIVELEPGVPEAPGEADLPGEGP